MVVWASRALKRTVKWIPDRQEAFQSDVQGRDHVSVAEMALDKDARFLGCRITTYAALGAYLNHFSVFIPTLAGSSMLNGGGTILLRADLPEKERFRGPGHAGYMRDTDGTDLIVYHAYDKQANGAPTLRIAKLRWGADGWPVAVIGEPK